MRVPFVILEITIRLYQTKSQYIIVLLILKMDFRSKYKKIHMYLFFIATQYLWKYALVEDIDNWTLSYILIIIYWNRQK